MSAPIPENTVEKPVSYWQGAWRRYRKNKAAVIGGVIVLLLVIVAIFTPVLAPYPYDEAHYEYSFGEPNAQFIFGTDDLGRDMLSRIMYGVRNAMTVALMAQIIILVFGVLFGALAAYHGGLIDTIIMRFVDIMYSFPTFLFQVIMVTVLDRNLFSIALAIGLVGWAGLARMVRGQVLALKQVEYVEAAKAMGAKDSHVIIKYLLPNAMGPIIISFMMGIPWAMMSESGLSLLGLGLRPPMPSFGNLLNTGNGMIMGFPHLLIWPVVVFALVLLSFNFVGDGLRDALDPKSEV